MPGSTKNRHLPWHQHANYWIIACANSEKFTPSAEKTLHNAGLTPLGGAMAIKTGGRWKNVWDALYAKLQAEAVASDVEIAVIPAEDMMPEMSTLQRKTPAAIDMIAQSLWLGDAVLTGRIMCYFQPVVSANDKLFGYESFARVKAEDGSIIGGDKIVEAGRALGIEFMIDRMLHIKAIETFAASDFSGFLFINFFPGFIHRPAVYLEGLSETVRRFSVVPKHIVLDFTRAEGTYDLSHLKSVCDYARSRGYSIALDDIGTLAGATRLIPDIRPDFVKIDTRLSHMVDKPKQRDAIHQLVTFSHNSGAAVIAEGVETAAMHTSLKTLGIDLFQGYHFSAPVPVEIALKKGTAH